MEVVVGPVIGKVTHESAIILLEVNATTELTAHVCLVDESCPQGRCIDVVSQTFVAGRPNTFVINALKPGRKYVVVFGGIRREDTESRIGRYLQNTSTLCHHYYVS